MPKIREINKFVTFRTKLLLLLGLFFLGSFFTLHAYQLMQPAFSASPVPHVTNKTYAFPTQIRISKVDIDLSIEETVITNGTWQISQKGVSHLTTSARPGEAGTSIMYGHNTNDRLGAIRRLVKGDTIEIKTSEGHTHMYAVQRTVKVAPTKMDIFNQSGETLVIYTCDGFADLERFVIIAKPFVKDQVGY